MSGPRKSSRDTDCNNSRTICFVSLGGPQTDSLISLAVITKKCTFMMDIEGKAIPFSSSDASKLVSSVIEPMATDGLRTIGIAYKDFIIGDTLTKSSVCLMSLHFGFVVHGEKFFSRTQARRARPMRWPSPQNPTGKMKTSSSRA